MKNVWKPFSAAKRKAAEWRSIAVTKHTRLFLLLMIALVNAGFILGSAAVLIATSKERPLGFLEGLYATITMILDAGCISFVVEHVTAPYRAVAAVSLVIIFLGTLIFTGALIGFVTNVISGFIDSVDAGKRRMSASGHTVILNWNTRASEIINDLLYKPGRQKVIVLVSSGKEDVKKEVEERIADTVQRERAAVRAAAKKMHGFKKIFYPIRRRFTKSVTVIVREGDVFSTKQLEDISIKRAKSVVILGADVSGSGCRYETKERTETMKRGNALTVKTLMQVADLTAAADSANKQTIVVEITDAWTMDLVKRIISTKESTENKNKIVPVDVNCTLGQLLAQFSLMPELNDVYSELFSNKGAAFYCAPAEGNGSSPGEYLRTHFHAVPLARMNVRGVPVDYFVAEEQEDGARVSHRTAEPIRADLDPDYANGLKNVIVLGHNSKMHELMEGFAAFKAEWSAPGNELRVTVIDDEASLDRQERYGAYPFVSTYAADIYDKNRITSKIREIVDANDSDTSVLILSDDGVAKEDVDANALTNLVYLQDIIREKIAEGEASGKGFDTESIDVIVEIIDPKHHDVVRSYSKNNVVISNRYISKMITQISESFELYTFYQDILSYDASGAGEDYESYEIYLKEAGRFFRSLPGRCTAAQLIRAVYAQSVDPAVFRAQVNPSLLLGYVRPHDKMYLFTGDQTAQEVELRPNDKLIVYSLH